MVESLVTPQWVDRNLAPSYFSKHPKARAGKIAITSVFYTIQGEGPFTGKPAVFVRLAGCNRGNKKDCPWCDTRFMIDAARWVAPAELAKEVLSKIPSGVSLAILVVTGGEPSLQPNVVALLKDQLLVRMMKQIESNGDYALPLPPSVVLVVSPKIGHKQERYSRLKQKIFEDIDYLKFVVSADENSPYHNLPDWVNDFDAPRVYVSPCTVYKRVVREREVACMWDPTLVDHQATSANYKYAARLCMEHGYTLSMQTHLFAAVE